MGSLFRRGNAIEKIAGEHVKFQNLWEDLDERRKKSLATVLELEDGFGGHKLIAAKKEMAEIQSQLEIYKAKQAKLLEKLEAEIFEEIQKARAQLPEVNKALQKEQRAGVEEAMGLLARAIFLLKAYCKTDELPGEFRFKETFILGGETIDTSDPPLLALSKGVYQRIIDNLPSTEPQAASFHDRKQKAIGLASRGRETDKSEAKIQAKREVRAARGEAV
jgi:hypothetical protein